jgi:hypothetical protein
MMAALSVYKYRFTPPPLFSFVITTAMELNRASSSGFKRPVEDSQARDYFGFEYIKLTSLFDSPSSILDHIRKTRWKLMLGLSR